MNTTQSISHHHTDIHDKTYTNLLWMGLLHLVLMYFIMFAMVDTWNDVVMNLNTFYMALMMASPMLIVMPLMMMKMYPDTGKNALVFGFATILFLGSFMFIRKQSFIDDKQFIRSMVPHHSGAILMCREASIRDHELQQLCNQISAGQRKEIEQMNRILERLD